MTELLRVKGVPNTDVLAGFEFDELSWITEGLDPREEETIVAATLPVRVLAFLLGAVAINAATIQQAADLPYGIDEIIDP